MTRHISEVYKEEASAVIDAKISVLSAWQSAGKIPYVLSGGSKPRRGDDGLPILDYFPHNPSEFCKWLPAMNARSTLEAHKEFSEFRSISPSTLGQTHNKERSKRVTELLDKLKRIAEIQCLQDNPMFVNEALSKERDFWKQIAMEGTKDVIKQRRKAARMERLYRREVRTRESNDNTNAEIIEDLEGKVGALTKELSKVRPIKASSKR
ncbi:hypothetical protein [Paraburkholderia xenovorans]|uniref:hypothetical protein n=1 Tax=Paraburkholderia xenovorans TaxID=36873 RepID=UPI0038BAABD2